MRDAEIEKIKSDFPGAYDIGSRLAVNPQRTASERKEADDLRQIAARNGWTQMVTQVAVELTKTLKVNE